MSLLGVMVGGALLGAAVPPVPVPLQVEAPSARFASPDARAVARLSDAGRLTVRRSSDRRLRFSAKVGSSNLSEPRVYWSPDGRRVLTETGDSRVEHVFDARTGRRVGRVDVGGTYLGRQPFSPDGTRVVTYTRITTVASGRTRRLPVKLDRPAWSPDGKRIAGQAGPTVTWIDVGGGVAGSVQLPSSEVAWSPDSAQLAVYGQESDDVFVVSVIDVATGTVTPLHRFPFGWEQGELTWSPDGTRLSFLTAAS